MKEFDGESLEDLLQRMTIVKSNDVRLVGHAKPFYVKLDRRAGHDMSCEMKAAELAEKFQIPCVEHLACGRSSAGNYLVTREFPDSLPADECFADRPPAPDELDCFADFVARIRRAPVRHDDFHLGNVLYSASQRQFALVDLHDFRQRTFWDRFRDGDDAAEIILQLRRYLPDAPLCAALERCGAADPEKFLQKKLIQAAKQWPVFWAKRRKQILGGYWKYTRQEGPLLLEKSLHQEDLSRAETETGTPEELEKRFCGTFALSLALIPCRKAAALDRETGKLYRIPMTGTPATQEEYGDFQRRLTLSGIYCPQIRWEREADGTIRFTGVAEA